MSRGSTIKPILLHKKDDGPPPWTAAAEERWKRISQSSSILPHTAHLLLLQRRNEGETIRINVKNKPSSGTGMMSAASLCGSISSSGNPNSAKLPPPSSAVPKITNCFPPPPNDPAFVNVSSSHHGLSGSSTNASKCNNNPSLEKLQTGSRSGMEKQTATASGWAAF